VGLQGAYATYPKTLIRSVQQAPGSGGDVSVFTQSPSALPPPVDQNAAWQAVNTALNANLKIQLVPTTDYATRTATVMAGADLPDLIYLDENLTIANIPQFLQTSFTDLTPFIGGDAIKDYPNLGGLPTNTWKQSVYGTGIYGVPVVRPFQFGVFINQTLFDAVGVSQPRNADDFKRILIELTNAAANQYGIAAIAPGYGALNQATDKDEDPMLAMFGGPNNWAVDPNGKFTKDIETEQFRATLAYVTDLYAAGVFYPDPTLTQTTLRSQFLAGHIGVMSTGWGSYGPLLWDPGLKQNPPITVRTLRPFSHDGSPPTWHTGSQMNGLTAVKKSSPERTQELLRILNFFAAPFGSEEYHLLNFGAQNTDHTFDAAGNPILTPQGQTELTIYQAYRYITRCMDVLFDPNHPEFAKVAYADEQAMFANPVVDPSLGLDSPTDRARSKQIMQAVYDGTGDIVTGRAPLSTLDQIVQGWRAAGGDQIRMEYQHAYAAAS
jgi:putative aldouronate transport system substrate-binding protein